MFTDQQEIRSAVKIGNTNQVGWYEPTTPTEKINSYLFRFNGFHDCRNVCLKSADYGHNLHGMVHIEQMIIF